MKHTLSLLTLAMLGLFVMAATVVAEVPSLMNYQGRLTDASGTPVADATYEVTFKIYDETSTQRWTETHSVPTSGGLFSVQLGSSGSPLVDTVFQYAECWLAIHITGESEMTPRQRLTAVPYAQTDGDWIVTGDKMQSAISTGVGIGGTPHSEAGLRVVHDHDGANTYGIKAVATGGDALFYYGLQGFAAGWTQGGNIGVQGVANGPASTNVGVYGDAFNATENYGGYFTPKLGVFGDISYDSLCVIDETTSGGGAITTWGPNESRNVRIAEWWSDPDHGAIDVMGSHGESRVTLQAHTSATDSAAGLVATRGPNGSENVVLTYPNANENNGYLSIKDENGLEKVAAFVDHPDGDGILYADQIVIQENSYGDLSAILPDNSINSVEILNESGIASEQTTSATGLSYPDMLDLETVTITIPEDGYILVQGKCYLQTSGTTGANQCSFQIDQTTGGGNAFPYVTRAGAGSSVTTVGSYYSIFTSRIYQKSAGEHTFIFEGKKDQASGSATAYHKIVTAMYFPTSYGSVMAMSENPGDLPGATPVNALAGEEPGDNKIMYEVDLRELELRAAKTRAIAMQAERDLLKAQMQATQSSSQEID